MNRLHLFGTALASLAFLLASLAMPGVLAAHPMGNFSTNQYTGVRVDNGQIRVRYRLDLAEIPTAQQMYSLDADGDGKVSDAERAAYLARQVPLLTGGLSLEVDGRPIKMSVLAANLQIRPGAADLPTLLITIECRAPLSAAQANAGEKLVLHYQDNNFPDRTGWREITPSDSALARVVRSDVPRRERSAALEAYPPDPTEAPPQEREARIVFEIIAPATAITSPRPANSNLTTPPPRNTATPQDSFTRLISRKEFSGGILLLSLAVAFILGSFHALSPGHGKTVVAAYLVGSRGTPRHAVLLGFIVTLTHVIGVFALGLAVLFASQYVLPESLYPWLGFGSGLLIVIVGVWQFTRRSALLYLRRRGLTPPGDDHQHGPGGHTHDLPDRITPGGLVALGVSGGIVPCPSALIVMLSAIALHRTAFGLVLIVVFSIGLASVLIAIGLLMLYARQLIDRLQWGSGLMLRLPLVSPLVVAALGAAIAAQAVSGAGLLRP